MEVVDAIKGVAYTVGADREPTHVEDLVRPEDMLTLPQEGETKRRILVWLNVAAVVILSMFVVWRYVKNRRKNTSK